MVKLPALPPAVGVAVIVTEPVAPTRRPVAVVELEPLIVMIEESLEVQFEVCEALKLTDVTLERLTVFPEQPDVQVTVTWV